MKKVYPIKLEEETISDLQEIAEKQDMYPSEVARTFIEIGVKKFKKNREDMRTAAEMILNKFPYANSVDWYKPIIEAMEEYANQSKWVSVETMPDYDGKCLCFIKQPQECENVWKYQGVRECMFNNWVTFDKETVTHWQPLPEKP